ncbi:subtilisin-like protease SBT4.3 [Zingiber officinale]|uniref:subtilisin-like protease SBT4.3 n=1 Tax=Zingiber officinale TaxID=94328 RepID=UPI001C4CC767|nr:subtilisin-like protease SBT4.3 [Zingiber officinale]
MHGVLKPTSCDRASTSWQRGPFSGVAALRKAAHPDQSPTAVKSAIMTTSDITDKDENPIKDEQHNKASFLGMGAATEKSTYKLKVDGLESVAVEVSPETLDFTGKINENKSFNISFSRTIAHPPTHEGHLL